MRSHPGRRFARTGKTAQHRPISEVYHLWAPAQDRFIRREMERAKVDVEVAAAGAKGHGVYALREFVRGETVIVGKTIDYPSGRTRMSVQVG